MGRNHKVCSGESERKGRLYMTASKGTDTELAERTTKGMARHRHRKKKRDLVKRLNEDRP